MFFFAENLVTRSMAQCLVPPWEFNPTEILTQQIRHSKEDRQIWYQNTHTKHQFYSAIEPLNPLQRVSRDNEPHLIHAFVADYDLPLTDMRVDDALTEFKIKPTWSETSLSGNRRLIWLLEYPLPVDSYEFCAHILQKAADWLCLNLLPGLDTKAFETASRLYCNGCTWRKLSDTPIPVSQSQSFFMRCGQSYRFRASNEEENLPLDIVEQQIKDQHPAFNWPSEFTLDSQGPSFWIPESTSPLSAIVKPGGMFTFSAHAAKPFYSWADLLGKEFVQKISNESLAHATADTWWDSKRYWRKIAGLYCASDRTELNLFLKVTCRLGSKPDSSGHAPIEAALDHIHNHQRIEAAVPFVFRPSGMINYQGKNVLNVYAGKPIAPAEGKQTWGAQGEFPFYSALLDALFVPGSQLPFWLAWLKHYYVAAINQTPLPGQNCVCMGDAGIGKTLTNREIVGVSVGGYVDASDYLVGGGTFNSHLLHVPHWCLDDDAPTNNNASQIRVHAMFKKLAANQQFEHNKKFEVSGMTEWMGRIGATTNLDFLSSRIVGPLDNSSLDKMNLFRCARQEEFKFVFPNRLDTQKLLLAQRPHFLRWLLDWAPPDYIERDPRYGFKSFQEPSLLDQTQQTSSAAPFKEMLLETLIDYFKHNAGMTEWRGTVTQLMRLLNETPFNDMILRTVKIEQVNRFLEQLQREQVIPCSATTGNLKTRVWKFSKPSFNE